MPSFAAPSAMEHLFEARVKNAEAKESTGTTTTMASRWKSAGFAVATTRSTIPKSEWFKPN